MKYNKAAMFGLDARIALAIFGALSVISGAALYSAIQQAKVIAVITDLEEINKAYTAFVLDTGQDLPEIADPVLYNDLYDLIENTKSYTNWNGPYLPYSKNATDTTYKSLQHHTYYAVRTAPLNNGTWGNTNLGDCTAGTKCFVWSMINNVPHDIAKAADIYVDGTYNKTEGNFRIHDSNGAAAFAHIYLKGQPTLSQP
tara:strand:+ start:1945 stop:2541 length:597 start_codon:yes stop_codon:yes gene_type:complete